MPQEFRFKTLSFISKIKGTTCSNITAILSIETIQSMLSWASQIIYEFENLDKQESTQGKWNNLSKEIAEAENWTFLRTDGDDIL